MSYHTQNNNIFIFDVDGTLTPPNEDMDGQFMKFFERWILDKKVFICTGATYQSIFSRLGRRIIEGCSTVFTCNGSSIWMKGKEVRIVEWRLPLPVQQYLDSVLSNTGFKIRSGPNIEHKVGMATFSVLGRGASADERERYKIWDKQTQERQKIVKHINEEFTDVEAFVTGETSIDIVKSGFNKAQIVKYFSDADLVTFVGNEITRYGADKPLADALSAVFKNRASIVKVSSWSETEKILKNTNK